MPNIEDQLRKKKPFKKKTARSYLGLGETLDDLNPPESPTLASSAETSTDPLNPKSDSKVVANYKQSNSNTPKEENTPGSEGSTKVSEVNLTDSPITAQNSLQETSSVASTLPLQSSENQPNYKQTNSKVVANYEQTNSKVVASFLTSEPQTEPNDPTHSKVIANYKQSNSKPIANYEQTTSSPIRTEIESISKVVAQPVAEVVANYEQTNSKLIATTPFAKLTGIQRILALFIYEECKRIRNRVTDEISVLDLIKITQADINTTKNAIHRIIQKGVIGRYEFKDGRAGWTRYELADSIYQEIREREFSGKLVANWKQSDSKVVAQPVAQLVASSSSSSSSLIKEDSLKTNTEIKPTSLNELPYDWDAIDYSALQELDIHFGKTHVRQIYSRNWCNSAQDLQASLNHFAYYMAHVKREKAPKEPIGHFMAVMRDGRFYGRPEGYLSPEERAEEARLESEQRKAEQLRSLQQKRFDALFEQWFASLRGTEIQALSPSVEGYDEKKKFLKYYFLEHFWLSIKDNPTVDVLKLRPSSDLVDPVSPTNSEFRAAFDDLDNRIQTNQNT